MASKSVNALSFKQLQDAVKEASSFRCRVRLEPDGGDGGKVFPPTYAGGVYAVENRRVDGRVVRCAGWLNKVPLGCRFPKRADAKRPKSTCRRTRMRMRSGRSRSGTGHERFRRVLN
jgi:hypothetical protein